MYAVPDPMTGRLQAFVNVWSATGRSKLDKEKTGTKLQTPMRPIPSTTFPCEPRIVTCPRKRSMQKKRRTSRRLNHRLNQDLHRKTPHPRQTRTILQLLQTKTTLRTLRHPSLRRRNFVQIIPSIGTGSWCRRRCALPRTHLQKLWKAQYQNWRGQLSRCASWTKESLKYEPRSRANPPTNVMVLIERASDPMHVYIAALQYIFSLAPGTLPGYI